MPEFEVRIMEILTTTVDVNAEDEDEAFWKVRDDWREEKIVLDSEDFYDVEFEVRPYEEIKGEWTVDYDKPVPRYDAKQLELPPAII